MDEVYTQKGNEVNTNPVQNNPTSNNPVPPAAPPRTIPAGIPVVTTGDWFVTMLITAIPLVGLIMLFVWAFGGGANPNKQNWAKAALIWMIISIVLMVMFFGVIFAAFYHNFNHESF